MKRTNNFTLAALAVLSLAGCTQDDERATGLPMTGTPLRPVAHVDAPVTREAMTTETLDHYYFRVTDQDGATTPEYDYFVEMTKVEDGQWSASEPMKWGTAYPKVSAVEQKGKTWTEDVYTTGGIVSVYTNQSNPDNLLESDLLYMPPTDITAKDLDADGNIKVNLKHRFAKLNVVVNITGTTSNPITELTIGGTKTQATFVPETDGLEETGKATPITAYCASFTPNDTDAPGCTATYECILLPQELEASTLKITAYLDETQSQEKTYTHASALTLQGNSQYTLNLSMDHEGKFTPSSSVVVGGWDNEDIEGGELEEGAEISEDGTYYVSTATGLLQWAQAAAQNKFHNLTLTANIDMKGKTWPAIDIYIYATIDGGGHTISNLAFTEKSETLVIGLIAGGATNCTIKDLTLLNPSIDVSVVNGGFFIGERAWETTMENCHVIGGTTNDEDHTGGLAYYAQNSSFIACSVTSSGVDMINTESTMNGEPCSITACYVTGGELVGSVVENEPTYTASYYQESADGSITAAGNSSAVTSWSEAAEKMNTALSETSYQWVENEEADAADRPLVIETQTTD